jgi:hypothetical protein
VPVNAAGVVGEASAPVRVEGDGDFFWMILFVPVWPLAVFLHHAFDRLPPDYFTVSLPDGSQTRPEREWFLAPGRLTLAHYRLGLALHATLALGAALAAILLFGRFGLITLLAVGAALHLYTRAAGRICRTPLPPGRWLLRRMMRRRVGTGGAPISVEAALEQPEGTRVRVRGRVRGAGEAGAYRRADAWVDGAKQIQEWTAPFALVDARGRVLAVDVDRLWAVEAPGARARVDDGDEVTVQGVIERRKLGIGHGAHPYSGDVVAVTLAAPAGGAVLLE